MIICDICNKSDHPVIKQYTFVVYCEEDKSECVRQTRDVCSKCIKDIAGYGLITPIQKLLKNE